MKVIGLIVFLLIVTAAIALKMGLRPSSFRRTGDTKPDPSTQPADAPQHDAPAKKKSGWFTRTIILTVVLIMVLGAGYSLVILIRAITAPTPAVVTAPVPLRECTTPCNMYWGWDETIWTDRQPVQVKPFKRDWILLEQQGNTVPLEKFNPGMAQFASPKDVPSMRVQIFSAK
jgi:hypothetical protein